MITAIAANVTVTTNTADFLLFYLPLQELVKPTAIGFEKLLH